MHGRDLDFYGTEEKIPDGICPLATHRCGWENNIKVNVKNTITYLCGMDYVAQDMKMRRQNVDICVPLKVEILHCLPIFVSRK
jgi:hypothetical protein